MIVNRQARQEATISPDSSSRIARWTREHALALTVIAGFLLFSTLALRAGSMDGYRFNRIIRIGHPFAGPGVLLPGQTHEAGQGYDGQFYFYIAQDPFLRDPRTVPALDNSLRYRRILYPFLAWVATLGHAAWLPIALVLVNIAACTATVAAVALSARRSGSSPWLALVVAIYPGLWIPLLLDLTEPVQDAFVTWGMLTESAGLVFLAAMAKETAAVVQLTEMARSLIARRWRTGLRHAFFLGIYLAWAGMVFLLVHARDSTQSGELFKPPFAAFRLLAQGPAHDLFLVPAILICVLSIVRMIWVRDGPTLGAAAYAVIGLSAGSLTWNDPLGYFRVIGVAGILTVMSWARHRDIAGASVALAMLVSGALGLALTLSG